MKKTTNVADANNSITNNKHSGKAINVNTMLPVKPAKAYNYNCDDLYKPIAIAGAGAGAGANVAVAHRYSKTLINSPNLVLITKDTNNNLKIEFTIEHGSIDLTSMLNFDLIQLICNINKDVYECFDLQIIDNDRAKLTVIMKHLLKDLGVPQTYSYLFITKTVRDNNVIFCAETIKGRDFPAAKHAEFDQLEQIPIKLFIFSCKIVNVRKIEILVDILFERESEINIFSDITTSEHCNNVLNFVEKMFCIIIKNIVSKLKQFIENVPF